MAVEWSKFYRIYQIDKHIRSNAYPSIASLSEKLEVSRRTIERDIFYMRIYLGAPIEYDRAKRGYCYSSKDFGLPSISLSEGEAVAVFLAQKVLSQYKGTPFEKPIQRAMAKILCVLPEEISVDFSLFDSAISFATGELRGDKEEVARMFEIITQAIKECRVLKMDYYTASRDKETSREVHPYHLRHWQNSWYLIGYCCVRDEIRIFAVDRIRRLEVIDDRYLRPSDFSVEEFLGGSLGIERGGKARVVIRFDEQQARFIREREWHPSQVVEELEDGGVTLTMDVQGLGEVKRWILGYGHHAEVLKPEWFREEIKREVELMGGRYG